jgi:hypothetical protein
MNQNHRHDCRDTQIVNVIKALFFHYSVSFLSIKKKYWKKFPFFLPKPAGKVKI